MFRASTGVVTGANPAADANNTTNDNKSEVKNIFLVDDETNGQSYDSCLAITGKEII